MGIDVPSTCPLINKIIIALVGLIKTDGDDEERIDDVG